MPALNYDYDYYEYRNGRRVGSAVPQRRTTTSNNPSYNRVKTQPVTRRPNGYTQRTVHSTRPVVQAKQNNVKKTPANRPAGVKKTNAIQSKPKSKIDIPIESTKKITNKPEKMTLNAPKTKMNLTAVLKKVALVSIFFCLFFMICYRYSVINEEFSNIKGLKRDLAEIKTTNEQLQADIESKTDLTYVENYAKYQLGMQKPTNSQIQYVSVEKQDKITTPVTIEESTEASWFENIMREIRKIVD